jgi:hypothetical protein
VLGTIDAAKGSPGNTETIGAEEGIAVIVRGKLHPIEGIGAEAKNPRGAIVKPDAGCINEELAGRIGNVAAGMFTVGREED